MVVWLLLGIVIGAVLMIVLASWLAECDEHRAEFARAQARRRMREVETTVLRRMAFAVERTQVDPQGWPQCGWPSERNDGPGTDVVEVRVSEVVDAC